MKTDIKKMMATACLALLGAGAFAQTSKGTMVVSGAINFTSENYETKQVQVLNTEGNRTSLNISPGVGKFYRDGLEVGISTGFGFARFTTTYVEGERINREYSIGIGPYIRKYIPITEKLHLTAGASSGISFGKTEYNYSNAALSSDNSRFTYGIGASPGLTYFATEKLGFSLNIGHIYFDRSTTYSSDSENKYIETDFGASISLSNSYIGLRYFINR